MTLILLRKEVGVTTSTTAAEARSVGISDGLIEELASAITERVPGVRELILFGSRADGTYSPESDMDLFVLVDGYERDRLHTTMACAAAAAAPARRRGLKRDVIASSVGDYQQRRALAGPVEREVFQKGVTIYAA